MKKQCLFLSSFLFCILLQLQAQQTEIKYYPKNTKAGDVYAAYNYGEYKGGVSSRIWVVDNRLDKDYYISALVNMQEGEMVYVYTDEAKYESIKAVKNGWQYIQCVNPFFLAAGKHTLRFEGKTTAVPMIEELFCTTGKPAYRGTEAGPATGFLKQVNKLIAQPVVITPGEAEVGDLSSKVLPNPQGVYDNAIDTSFSYSHFSWVYLTAGSHTFTTSGSTVTRSLTVFNPSDYTYSWSNVNGGPGGESGLYLNVGLAGYYAVTLRPYPSGSGTANIILDGSTLVSNAVVGGRTYTMSTLKGGVMNSFTCRLTTGDTRIIASRYFASSARAYNDDYSGGGGDWNWGLASRIKKDFGTDSVQYGFVCAYSPSGNGECDIYLGAGGVSNLPINEPQNFPLLKQDDAIKTAQGGYYNCISWSGGVTSTWIWPISSLSTYNCNSANYLLCFDNFYSNNPVRYPGAWNYTRTGATVNNAVVDLWKTASAYTHASVRKPGNSHPHGYDWESKPGGLERTFHPRNALTNANWYGSVSNYYTPTGTYARNAVSYATDADAVKAGVAIFDVAELTSEANNKLSMLLRKTEGSFSIRFNELYEAWQKTWQENISMSDPAAYCKNKEYTALASFASTKPKQALVLIFEKFVNKGDHLIGELLCSLAKEKYSPLLTAVKQERAARPNDEAGRYRIHGDHDNGVLYIEKILKDFTLEEDTKTEQAEQFITVMPNPVKDRITVKLTVLKSGKAAIRIISGQTQRVQILLTETELSQGVYQYTTLLQNFAGSNGDVITVQLITATGITTTKAIVVR
jgi:hypothetical protein